MLKAKFNTYFLVGSFFFLSVILLILFFVFKGGLFEKRHQYYAEFNNVAGLQLGASILYEGYTIGDVKEIIPKQKENNPIKASGISSNRREASYGKSSMKGSNIKVSAPSAPKLSLSLKDSIMPQSAVIKDYVEEKYKGKKNNRLEDITDEEIVKTEDIIPEVSP